MDKEAAIREAELRELEVRQECKEEGCQVEKKITARLLLTEGFDVETVVRLSRLTDEQVLKIRQDMN